MLCFGALSANILAWPCSSLSVVPAGSETIIVPILLHTVRLEKCPDGVFMSFWVMRRSCSNPSSNAFCVLFYLLCASRVINLSHFWTPFGRLYAIFHDFMCLVWLVFLINS